MTRKSISLEELTAITRNAWENEWDKGPEWKDLPDCHCEELRAEVERLTEMVRGRCTTCKNTFMVHCSTCKWVENGDDDNWELYEEGRYELQ